MAHSHFIPPLSRGFLPLENPLQKLPEETSRLLVNFVLNRVMENLPQLIREKKLRSEIDRLNAEYERPYSLISLNQFDHREVENAWLVMTMLRAAYLREDVKNSASTVPAILSDNFKRLEEVNPRLSMLTYSGYMLHNWKLVDKNKEVSLENIAPIYTFTGHPAEAWFIKVHVAAEAAFAGALVAANQLAIWAETREIVPLEELGQCFGAMTRSIQEAAQVIEKMRDGCDLLFFRTMLQPFLKGIKSINSNAYQGSLGVQNSAFLALDSLLSIEQANDQMTTLLDRVPATYQHFIQGMQRSDVRGLLHLNGCPGLAACKDAIAALEVFRKKYAEMADYYFPAVNRGANGGFKSFFGKRAEEIAKIKATPEQLRLMLLAKL